MIRPAGVADLDAIAALEARSRPSPWTRAHFETAIASDVDRLVVLESEGAVVGFACWRVVVDEAELADIVVDRDRRGAGLGRRLLDACLSDARARGAARVHLEVRAGNAPAIGLYRSAGFEDGGRRPRYYADGEDALVMQRVLTGERRC